jgi:hypothetical protein
MPKKDKDMTDLSRISLTKAKKDDKTTRVAKKASVKVYNDAKLSSSKASTVSKPSFDSMFRKLRHAKRRMKRSVNSAGSMKLSRNASYMYQLSKKAQPGMTPLRCRHLNFASPCIVVRRRYKPMIQRKRTIV